MNASISKQKVDAVFAELLNNVKTASVRTKLTQVNNACEKISASGVVSVASVIKFITADGVRLTKRTVYNDRAGGNPYKKLIEAWIEHSEITHSEKKNNSKSIELETSLSLIDEEDLKKISDISLRHKFSLMYGELKSLRNQVNILKDIKELPIVSQDQISHLNLDEDLSLKNDSIINISEYEKEVIRSFLNPTSNSLAFDEDGALISRGVIKRNETLSMEGFKDLLERLSNQ
tara:strand:+ start:37 stop:735 length:699 start_codon:yes stop_codon:yes gene_type:complete